MPPRAILIGAPGAGKSTTGRRVAERMGLEFADSDHLVEETVGMSVADYFVEHGEEPFRILEHEVIEKALTTFNGILALGGGAVMNSQTAELLEGHTIVWLKVSLADAAARVGLNASRPLLLGNVRGTLVKLLEQRTPVYERLATITIDTTGLNPKSVASAVVDALSDVQVRGESPHV